MGFAKFIIDKLRARPSGHNGAYSLPIDIEAGQEYGPMTVPDPPTIEIDWDELQRQIEDLEREMYEATRSSRRCELCRYYVEAKSACHRFPPVLYYDKPNNMGRYLFPTVMKLDWCDEFIDKGALPS